MASHPMDLDNWCYTCSSKDIIYPHFLSSKMLTLFAYMVK